MAEQVMGSKRKAIADSNRTMFIWVAAMSAVVGVCLVVSIFLVQQIIFKSKVVSQVTTTVNMLNDDNKAASDLTSNVVVLETNPALNSIKTDSDEKALSVVLDALPSERNPLALGASLQQVLLSGVDGLSIDSIAVDNTDMSGTDETTNTTDDGIGTIPIQLQVSSSSVTSIRDMLVRFESSIRVIDIDNFVLERGDNGYQATITAHAYYQPAKQIQLTDKTITAKDARK